MGLESSCTQLAKERAALCLELERDRGVAVVKLRELDERWARAVLELPADGAIHEQVQAFAAQRTPDQARSAIPHLVNAESWQWEIGTWSTGSGEGLASMYEVYSLQLARAWAELLVSRGGDAAARDRAGRIAREVWESPNGFGPDVFASSISALRTALGTAAV